MSTPKTNIFSANGLVNIAREEMKDPAISKVFLCAGVFLLYNLSVKRDTALAGLGLNELQELLAQAV